MSAMTKYMLLRRDRSGRVITHTAQLVALHAGVTALEVESLHEGRLILLEAAKAAGLDIKAFAWQAIPPAYHAACACPYWGRIHPFPTIHRRANHAIYSLQQTVAWHRSGSLQPGL